jgi:hypothetical protein
MKKPEQLEVTSKITLDSGVVIRLSSYAPAITTPRGKFLRYDCGRIITAISLAAGEDDIHLIRICGVDDYSDSLNLLKIALKIDAEKFTTLLAAIRTDQGVVNWHKGIANAFTMAAKQKLEV